jgi:lysophospholipase L1-like esterase
MRRPEQPEPFLRGCAFAAGAGVSYPRADARDMSRLPIDTWGTASLPVGVRFEWVGDAESVRISYRTDTDDLGYRGDGAGRTFALWRDGACIAEERAALGDGTVELACGGGDLAGARAILYLPEGMKPTVLSIEPERGTIEPPPPQPRWIAYGDSLAEGWVASRPDGAWPAITGRQHGLDVVNMGYAGSARGELVSAEHVGDSAADVISITHGTNCWTRIAHSAGQMRENTRAFLEVVRQFHPVTPIVLASPVVRPDAESTPNRLGATLADLRAAMEDVGRERIERGDTHLTLVAGGPVLGPEHLADGIHPGDEGPERMAVVFGRAVAAALRSG